MSNFFTRPHFEDRQHVQYPGDSITLSGITSAANTGKFIINPTVLDFTGTTTGQTSVTLSGLNGFLNQGRLSGLVVEPPKLVISGSTGYTTVDVTGYVLKAYDSGGTVTWEPVVVSADTNTYVTGGTLNASSELILGWNNGGTASPIDLSVLGDSGSTLVPLIFNQSITEPNNGIQPSFGSNTLGTGSTYSSILGGRNNYIKGGSTNHIVGSNHEITSEGFNTSILGGYGSKIKIAGTLGTELPEGSNIIASNFSGIYGGYASNIIGGGQNYIKTNYQLNPTVYSGSQKSTNYSTIIGGYDNNIYGFDNGALTIIGGMRNTIKGARTYYSTIAGGSNNEIRTNFTTGINNGNNFIGNGGNNILEDTAFSIIGGGRQNTMYDSTGGVIVGGRNNQISGSSSLDYSFIGGGNGNNITVISGGSYVFKHNTVLNGKNNTIQNGYGAEIIGGFNNNIKYGGYVNSIVGGQGNYIGRSTPSSGGFNGLILTTKFEYGLPSYGNFIGNGVNNTIKATSFSSIVGGDGNTITGTTNNVSGTTQFGRNFIGGGKSNLIYSNNSFYSNILGGAGNEINSSSFSSIIGGGANYINGGSYNLVSGGKGNQITGSSYSSILGGQNNNVLHNNAHVIGSNLISVAANTTHVERFNINTLGTGTSVNNLGIDASGNVVTGTTGGATNNVSTIDPYFDAGSSTGITWNVSGQSTNYEITITANTTINLTNVRDGDYGTLWVEQGNAAGNTIIFGTINGAAGTHIVVNGGGGSPTLTTGTGNIDILTFTYNGNSNKMAWSVGNDYT